MWKKSNKFETWWRKFGRFVSKDGFVDAQQSIHRATLKPLQRRKSFSEIETVSKSNNLPKIQKDIRIELSSVDIANIQSDKSKQNERHMKVIEDQMIKSKQVERALKRQEGDVKKDQRQIRQSVREFDTSSFWSFLYEKFYLSRVLIVRFKVVSKKRLDADKNLVKNLEEKKTLEIENSHKTKNVCILFPFYFL